MGMRPRAAARSRSFDASLPAMPVSTRLAVAGLLLLLLGSGCYSEMPAPQVAKLRVVAEPDTTTVYIDDRYIGTARVLAARPATITPGVKFITFKAPDHFPHDV